jgi:ankyrin repeat protein
MVQLLLTNNAKVDSVDVHGKSVLHLAAACGHLVCLQTILAYLTEKDISLLDGQECSALHWACYNGNANCVEFLLENNVFDKLEGNPFSAAHCSAFAGSERCLELLLVKFGSSIAQLKDSRDRTPLHIAALHGHVECAKLLIQKGGDVRASDEDGRTPLIAAAQYGQAAFVEYLLGSGDVDRTAQDRQGNTALHWACYRKHNHIALLLLENGDDGALINAANNDGKTALHLSSRNGLVDVTKELLQKGASVSAVDNEGLTPALCCAPNINVAQCLALILQNLPESNVQSKDTYTCQYNSNAALNFHIHYEQ